MLQRKYFSYKDAVQIRKLTHYLKRTNLVDKEAMNQFDEKLNELKNSEVELSLQNGAIVQGRLATSKMQHTALFFTPTATVRNGL